MKFKIGDRVKVRKDLEVGKFYDGMAFGEGMNTMRGKEVTIKEVIDDELAIIDDGMGYAYSFKMFEPITNLDKVKEEIRMEDILSDNCNAICDAIHRVRKEENCGGISCAECYKWLEQPCEEHKDILDKQEKEYLSAIIKPFKKRVDYIQKLLGGRGEFIIIAFDNDSTCLPYFKRDTMYKGMEIEKRYTLKELGL